LVTNNPLRIKVHTLNHPLYIVIAVLFIKIQH